MDKVMISDKNEKQEIDSYETLKEWWSNEN